MAGNSELGEEGGCGRSKQDMTKYRIVHTVPADPLFSPPMTEVLISEHSTWICGALSWLVHYNPFLKTEMRKSDE